MHRQNPISPTHEMYLKVLYEVRGKHEVARVRDMAKGLGISPGAVSGVLKKLEQAGFVEHERYGVVALTPAGLAVAECMMRRHSTIRDVLIEIFGVEPATAADDACMMEHAVSPATLNRLRVTLHRHREERGVTGVGGPGLDLLDCSECEASGQCQAMVAGAN